MESLWRVCYEKIKTMSEEARQIIEAYGDDPSDQRSMSLDDTSSTEESADNIRLCLETSNDSIPYIGQRFVNHDAAYEYYSEFAKRCGFSIRRHRTEEKVGVGKGLTRRYFVCHRAGNTPIKTCNESKPQRNRKSSRCGCHAYLRISKTQLMASLPVTFSLLILCSFGVYGILGRGQREFDYFALSLLWPGTICQGTKHCCPSNGCCSSDLPAGFTIRKKENGEGT